MSGKKKNKNNIIKNLKKETINREEQSLFNHILLKKCIEKKYNIEKNEMDKILEDIKKKIFIWYNKIYKI